MLDVDVIEEPAAAAAALDPLRSRILGVLVEPGSATTVASALGESRQKVNYHLRALEAHGLVRFVAERQRRGLTERVLVATARAYVVSPAALGDRAPEPAEVDRLSAQYVLALSARLVREVGSLVRGAERAGKRLPTLAIDTEVRFASAADRAAFTDQLTAAVTSLVARYHDESAPEGRWHRLVVAAHPTPSSVARPGAEPAHASLRPTPDQPDPRPRQPQKPQSPDSKEPSSERAAAPAGWAIDRVGHRGPRFPR